jgi:hypothetical protein
MSGWFLKHPLIHSKENLNEQRNTCVPDRRCVCGGFVDCRCRVAHRPAAGATPAAATDKAATDKTAAADKAKADKKAADKKAKADKKAAKKAKNQAHHEATKQTEPVKQ